MKAHEKLMKATVGVNNAMIELEQALEFYSKQTGVALEDPGPAPIPPVENYSLPAAATHDPRVTAENLGPKYIQPHIAAQEAHDAKVRAGVVAGFAIVGGAGVALASGGSATPVLAAAVPQLWALVKAWRTEQPKAS